MKAGPAAVNRSGLRQACGRETPAVYARGGVGTTVHTDPGLSTRWSRRLTWHPLTKCKCKRALHGTPGLRAANSWGCQSQRPGGRRGSQLSAKPKPKPNQPLVYSSAGRGTNGRGSSREAHQEEKTATNIHPRVAKQQAQKRSRYREAHPGSCKPSRPSPTPFLHS